VGEGEVTTVFAVVAIFFEEIVRDDLSADGIFLEYTATLLA